MAKYREAPCERFVCHGECSKGHKDAAQNGICQTCKDYLPRKGYKSIGDAKRRKEKNKYYE